MAAGDFDSPHAFKCMFLIVAGGAYRPVFCHWNPPMLTHEVETLFAILHSPNASEDACIRAVSAFMEHLPSISEREELLEVEKRLAEVFDWPDMARASYAAFVGGAMVESGFPPAPFSEAIATRLPLWANDVARFHERLIEQTGTLPEDEDGAYEGRFAQVFETLSFEMPQEYDSWARLQTFYLPIVSVLCMDAELREELKGLSEVLSPLTETHEGADWISKLLCVYDKAPLLVIEPATKRGFVGLMSGIADNFQLHALLMSAFSEVDGEERLSSTAKAIFEGEGEPEIEETVSSHWNLFNWQALNEHGMLPDALTGMPHWIWNEGTPADISTFEGFHVVLIGEPLYERMWPAKRLFSALPAQIEVEHVLTLGETTAWLSKLAEASH